MSDEWKSFVSVGEALAAHDSVRHSEREYARGTVYANSVEGFNDRVRVIRGLSTISAYAMPIYTSMKLAFAGPSGWWPDKQSGAPAKVDHSSNRCGRGSLQRISCPRPSDLQLDARCDALRVAGSRSSARLLSLVHKAIVIYPTTDAMPSSRARVPERFRQFDKLHRIVGRNPECEMQPRLERCAGFRTGPGYASTRAVHSWHSSDKCSHAAHSSVRAAFRSPCLRAGIMPR